jgi:hypothetical protein
MNLIERYLGEGDKIAGWIAIYNGKKLEIKKSEANGIYGAKQLAIKKLKVPKSKQGLLAIEPAYDDVKEGSRESKFTKDGMYASQAMRHVEDAQEAIKQFVKEGKLNKKHMSNLNKLESDLASIWRKSEIG